MNQLIDKTTLKHLAELVRLKLTTKESEKFIKDLKKILNHFEELKEVDTEEVKPMTGGHSLKNVFRDDEIDFQKKTQLADETGRILESFPDTEKGYLKVPKIL